MSDMNLLIDTNVVLDWLLAREPFTRDMDELRHSKIKSLLPEDFFAMFD